MWRRKLLQSEKIYDIFVIGGGVNGCGIARDAVGRGLTVCLAEMNDIGSGTSSASTKLIHGGLRYLKYFDFRLVKESLKEREVLLANMPHICWPMRFILPSPKKILRRIIVRLGLLLYDNLGGRTKLPGSKNIRLKHSNFGTVLKKQFSSAFLFSDCWVEDSRLVVLNAMDARKRGAQILTRTKVKAIEREEKYWKIITEDPNGKVREFFSHSIVNATGPWVDTFDNISSRVNRPIHLVRGSHLVVKRMFDHDHSYFLLGDDGRIIFVIPYQKEFTLIGTTEQPHENINLRPTCSREEAMYLIDFVNSYFDCPIGLEKVVWSYSGIRPLYQKLGVKKGSLSSMTRDYMLNLESNGGLPILTVYGGKLTTYRKLSENVLSKLNSFFPKMLGPWTSHNPLPGGDFMHEEKNSLVEGLCKKYPFLDREWSQRLVNGYGTLSEKVLGNAKTKRDLGIDFGNSLTEKEVRWLIEYEFAESEEDILWRRTKLGLKFSKKQKDSLSKWFKTLLERH